MRFSIPCKGHHDAYKSASRLLHRDINERNLEIWDRSVNEDPQYGMKSTGVLIGWDNWTPTDEHGQELSEKDPLYLTLGTFRFMACELIRKDKILRHLYRHDLESFFYVLLWASIHYDFANKERNPTQSYFRSWDRQEPSVEAQDAHYTKSMLMLDDLQEQGICPLEGNKELFENWVKPLHHLFWEANVRRLHVEAQGRPFDYDTYDGMLTFENVLYVLSRSYIPPFTPWGTRTRQYEDHGDITDFELGYPETAR